MPSPSTWPTSSSPVIRCPKTSIRSRSTSDVGTRLGSGVYFYRISAGADRAQKKLVIVD
jgi:hypothetical protein